MYKGWYCRVLRCMESVPQRSLQMLTLMHPCCMQQHLSSCFVSFLCPDAWSSSSAAHFIFGEKYVCFSGLRKRMLIGTGHGAPGASVGRAGKGQWPKATSTSACHRTSVREAESKRLRVSSHWGLIKNHVNRQNTVQFAKTGSPSLIWVMTWFVNLWPGDKTKC